MERTRENPDDLILVKGRREYYDFPLIRELVNEYTEGVEFPCFGMPTGEYGDSGEPVLRLPNGKELSAIYLYIGG